MRDRQRADGQWRRARDGGAVTADTAVPSGCRRTGDACWYCWRCRHRLAGLARDGWRAHVHCRRVLHTHDNTNAGVTRSGGAVHVSCHAARRHARRWSTRATNRKDQEDLPHQLRVRCQPRVHDPAVAGTSTPTPSKVSTASENDGVPGCNWRGVARQPNRRHTARRATTLQSLHPFSRQACSSAGCWWLADWRPSLAPERERGQSHLDPRYRACRRRLADALQPASQSKPTAVTFEFEQPHVFAVHPPTTRRGCTFRVSCRHMIMQRHSRGQARIAGCTTTTYGSGSWHGGQECLGRPSLPISTARGECSWAGCHVIALAHTRRHAACRGRARAGVGGAVPASRVCPRVHRGGGRPDRALRHQERHGRVVVRQRRDQPPASVVCVSCVFSTRRSVAIHIRAVPPVQSRMPHAKSVQCSVHAPCSGSSLPRWWLWLPYAQRVLVGWPTVACVCVVRATGPNGRQSSPSTSSSKRRCYRRRSELACGSTARA